MTEKAPPAPPGEIVLTATLIERCESLQRSYTVASILFLAGDGWLDACGRPIHGWKRAAVGRVIARADYAAALAARSPRWHRRQGDQLQATLDLGDPTVAQVAGHASAPVQAGPVGCRGLH